jgi:hypothetical protein
VLSEPLPSETLPSEPAPFPAPLLLLPHPTAPIASKAASRANPNLVVFIEGLFS